MPTTMAHARLLSLTSRQLGWVIIVINKYTASEAKMLIILFKRQQPWIALIAFPISFSRHQVLESLLHQCSLITGRGCSNYGKKMLMCHSSQAGGVILTM